MSGLRGAFCAGYENICYGTTYADKKKNDLSEMWSYEILQACDE